MGHYFNKIELENFNIKIEALPKELVNLWYEKGWVLRFVKRTKRFGGSDSVVSDIYPIAIEAYTDEFLKSLTGFKNNESVEELRQKVTDNFDMFDVVILWIG